VDYFPYLKDQSNIKMSFIRNTRETLIKFPFLSSETRNIRIIFKSSLIVMQVHEYVFSSIIYISANYIHGDSRVVLATAWSVKRPQKRRCFSLVSSRWHLGRVAQHSKHARNELRGYTCPRLTRDLSSDFSSARARVHMYAVCARMGRSITGIIAELHKNDDAPQGDVIDERG